MILFSKKGYYSLVLKAWPKFELNLNSLGTVENFKHVIFSCRIIPFDHASEAMVNLSAFSVEYFTRFLTHEIISEGTRPITTAVKCSLVCTVTHTAKHHGGNNECCLSARVAALETALLLVFYKCTERRYPFLGKNVLKTGNTAAYHTLPPARLIKV